MKRIELTQGQVSLIDDMDFERVSQFKWTAKWNSSGNRFYAYRMIVKTLKGKRSGHSIYMHRFILDAPKGLFVDHIDGNSLNNLRSNLRLATAHQNMRNQTRVHVKNTSGYRGISWHPRAKKWVARAHHNGKNVYLGIFSDAQGAARAFDSFVIEHYGEFTGKLNFEKSK